LRKIRGSKEKRDIMFLMPPDRKGAAMKEIKIMDKNMEKNKQTYDASFNYEYENMISDITREILERVKKELTATERKDNREYLLTNNAIREYELALKAEEKAPATLNKYLHDVEELKSYAERLALRSGIRKRENILNKEILIEFKTYLIEEKKLKTSSVNSYIASINHFLKVIGREDLQIKNVKSQRKSFCEEEKMLTRQEYEKMIAVDRYEKGSERLDKAVMLAKTLAATGIRISELKYITIENLKGNVIVVFNKKKERKILLSEKVREELLDYSKKVHVKKGPVFVDRAGNPVSRKECWRQLKKLARHQGVQEQKVFPHNFRHLFAREYYERYGDISEVADILGHSNLNTTRVYLIKDGREQLDRINKMNL
jgi:site-specific recombinase XerD